ncbi:MAG TPA: hypothetical protein VJN21_11740 [Candidatus Acidoferrales bacterium]|nr:hypothetical protein [Candidatus Acidoferrales bacterium]
MVVEDVFLLDADDGLVPPDGVAHAGVGADGFDIGRGGEFDFVAALEEIFESEKIIFAAAGVEANSLRMAVKIAVVFEVEVVGDVARAAPVNELFLDFFAIRVPPDEQGSAKIVRKIDTYSLITQSASIGSQPTTVRPKRVELSWRLVENERFQYSSMNVRQGDDDAAYVIGRAIHN